MGTMMALRAHARGGPEQLLYEQAPAPAAGPGEALVAVHAAAITFAELTWDLEWTTQDGRDRTPVIPSHEMSGTVARLGDGVTGLAVGDEVIGLIDFDRDGAAAEYVTVPAASLVAKPQSVSHAAGGDAAARGADRLAGAGRLRGAGTRRAGPGPGGAGGVGLFAVQLAAILGAQVSATGRAADADFVRDLGAERFISAGAGARPGRGRARRRHRHRWRRGAGRLLRPAARGRPAGHPRRAPGPGTRAVQGPRHVFRRRAGPRRAGQAGASWPTRKLRRWSARPSRCRTAAGLRKRRPCPAARQDGPDRPLIHGPNRQERTQVSNTMARSPSRAALTHVAAGKTTASSRAADHPLGPDAVRSSLPSTGALSPRDHCCGTRRSTYGDLPQRAVRRDRRAGVAGQRHPLWNTDRHGCAGTSARRALPRHSDPHPSGGNQPGRSGSLCWP